MLFLKIDNENVLKAENCQNHELMHIYVKTFQHLFLVIRLSSQHNSATQKLPLQQRVTALTL